MLNSLLVLLNSRDALREKISEPISVHLSRLRMESVVPQSEPMRKCDEGQVADISVEC